MKILYFYILNLPIVMLKRFILLLLFAPLALMAQKITVEEYIETYKDIAMREMKEHKIPASITLAQGIIESGAGNSALAREAKNHFGIKCHKGWTGKTYTMDDDAKDECFRRYKKAEDSYRDHSEFLTSRSRYAGLFELDIMDYKAWARGLKAAGYATSPTYATALINRIEMNKLYLYDQIAMGKISEKEAKKKMAAVEEQTVEEGLATLELAYSPVDRSVFELVDMTEDKRFIYENNHVRFIFAKEGETVESLAKELGIRKKKLCKYNLIKRPDEMVFHQGDVVYLEQLRKKNWKAKKYVTMGGETVRDIALRFAVRPEKIMKRNRLEEGAPLKAGQKIKLR
ncbi:MAG: glucosaminidase domain-containing protein [Bacteroidales bacterium]|nr:glucosaminidase domain-containing protein [Bacteroidales bacterium]